jgi:hypothetical protein
MGAAGRATWGAFATVLGDESVISANQANYEHLPQYANDPTSVGLTANERQVDQGPSETTASLANRAVGAVDAAKLFGTPLGVLTALYWAGFSGAQLVQQNGNRYQIAVTVAGGITTISLVVSDLGPNPPIGGIRPLAAGIHPWWTFDASGLDANSDQYNSRFAVLFLTDTGLLSTAENRNRLRRSVKKWKNAKSRFMGFVVCSSGIVWGGGWTWGDGHTWGGTATNYSPDEE